MCELTIKEIRIGDKIIEEVIDRDGVRWYPLKSFLQKILCKHDKVSTFRDSEMSRYMKVFEYYQRIHGTHRLIKTWCMNENGIKYLLRHMSIRKIKNEKLYRAREKGFLEACIYFHVKKHDELSPLYINIMPDIKDYDIWSILCIMNDVKINADTRWKKCQECRYYYPDNVRYFGNNKKEQKKCLQCQDKNFSCNNKTIQYIYDHDGLDLLYKLYTHKDDRIIVEALKEFINKEVFTNDN